MTGRILKTIHRPLNIIANYNGTSEMYEQYLRRDYPKSLLTICPLCDTPHPKEQLICEKCGLDLHNIEIRVFKDIEYDNKLVFEYVEKEQDVKPK